MTGFFNDWGAWSADTKYGLGSWQQSWAGTINNQNSYIKEALIVKEKSSDEGTTYSLSAQGEIHRGRSYRKASVLFWFRSLVFFMVGHLHSFTEYNIKILKDKIELLKVISIALC